MTDKVRIRSLVQRTRVVIVDVMAKDEREAEPKDDESFDDSMDDNDDDEDDAPDLENEDEWAMEIAKAYDRTLVELGETLGADS